MAKWKCLSHHEDLQRSSHNVSVVDHRAYIFGGELVSREPRDNKVFSLELNSEGASDEVAYHRIKLTMILDASTKAEESSSAPSPRVGSASTTLASTIYLFSGRGGAAMAPIEENGGLWRYDTASASWSMLTPIDTSAAFPPARSYHCMASDGQDSVFVHAGCPKSGRLADLWRIEQPPCSQREVG